MNCQKCDNEMSKFNGLYNDYYHCEVCFYCTYRALDCCCRKPDIKYVTLSGQLRIQCFQCGAMPGSALKQNLVPDISKVPVCNQKLRDESYDKISDERKRFFDWVNKMRIESFNSLYGEYLSSDKWQALRFKILERDSYICQGCLSNKATQVHHLTYDRLYDECCFDLVSVCNSCHSKIHSK